MTAAVREFLEKAYGHLRDGSLSQAVASLEEALSVDFESQAVVALLKCAHFWRDRERNARELRTAYEQAEYLAGQWPAFAAFLDRIGSSPPETRGVFRHHVSMTCLGLYRRVAEEAPATRDADLLLRLGRCYKGIGEYDRALEYLESAYQLRKEDAAVTSELADSYALVNETQRSKAFFREAFFINPREVDIEGLESEMMRRLVERVKEFDHHSSAFAEWVPVYGVLLGVFTVKRELRSIEYGKLKQAIFAMEVELRESPGAKAEQLVPRLLYRYFWLIDHYMLVKEDRERIREVLLKIKSLNKEIYEQYSQ